VQRTNQDFRFEILKRGIVHELRSFGAFPVVARSSIAEGGGLKMRLSGTTRTNYDWRSEGSASDFRLLTNLQPGTYKAMLDVGMTLSAQFEKSLRKHI